MEVEATRSHALDVDADAIVLGVFAGESVGRELAGGEDARGSLGATVAAYAEGRRFILVGMGPRSGFGAEAARVAAANAQRRAVELGARRLCWELPAGVGPELVAALVQGTMLRAYRFERYRREGENAALERLVLSSPDDVSVAVREAAAVCAAQNRARDLANTPANELTPAALAGYALEVVGRLDGVEVEVAAEEQIRDAGMGAFAAVARGSAESARLVTLRYDGGDARRPLLGLVGKGVTFDAGGLSLKAPAKMDEMKFDMAGAAAVLEAIAALAELRAPVRVVGVVGATENLPSGSAIKPGDVVTALDGTTIEINNTDAEGRLVLADCLSLARREGCERLIDVATLTGGVVTALGSFYAGFFCNDGPWAERVTAAATRSGEDVWRLPLDPRYAKMMSGRYAQLTNHSERREATPITGAEFLHHFAGDVPWAHLDIAGTGYDVPLDYFAGKGATGFGVRLLVELAREMDGGEG